VYFTHSKCQKCIADDVRDVRCIFAAKTIWGWVRFIHLVMQEYDSKCLKMYLITLKVFKICYKCLAPITKVNGMNEGESNTPCPSTMEASTPRVEHYLKPCN
jgi:hypothetical protein